jgi:hypothetical protein
MIWDHAVPYDYIFMDNIELVDINFFAGKKYIYNPTIEQSELYNDVQLNYGCETYLIIESCDELIHKDMKQGTFIMKRKELYLKMLRENMGGMLLGQINLIDFPKYPFCCVVGDKCLQTNIPQFKLDENIFDIKTDEVKEYVRILVYSKACILVNTNDKLNTELVDSSKISLIPVVHTQVVAYENDIKNYVTSFLDYNLVINPDVKKISLL